MAKKIKKLRGTIRPLVKPFPPLGRMHWRKQKTLSMLVNRHQWQREFDVDETQGVEIEMEHLSNYFLVTQASTQASPAYIITE